MHRIVVVSAEAPDYVDLLKSKPLDDASIIGFDDVEQARTAVSDCDIMLGEPSLVARLLDDAPELAWVQSTFAGVEPLCRSGLRRDYVLTGVKGIFGPLMSEYVFAHILARERRLFDARADQGRRRWHPLPYRSLQGLVMGICGFGSIGRHIAGTAVRFGMRVHAYKRSAESDDLVECVYTGEQLPDFLRDLDYLVLALPSTSRTRHLIDGNALGAMKSSATLINVGRGDAVSESDLVEALEDGRLAGAVLDVFEREPLPESSRLWTLDTVTVTPHAAAVSFPRDIVEIFHENFARFREGRTLDAVIDFSRGY